MGLDRKRGVSLILDYFPTKESFGQGTIGFDHIAKDYGNSGTTCGFPTHWMLWRLGCGDKSLVNRYEPDSGYTYTDTANLSRIFHNPAFVNIISSESNRERFLSGEIAPQPGDTIFISSGLQQVKVADKNKDGSAHKDESGNQTFHVEGRYKEHVYQVISDRVGTARDKITWRVANSGMGEEGKQKATILPARGVTYDKASGVWRDTLDQRQFYGWLDLDKLAAGTEPNIPKEDPLAYFSLTSSTGPPKPESVFGVWKISNGDCYMFYKGHRVFRVASGNLQIIKESGFWYPFMGEVRVKWAGRNNELFAINGNSANVQIGAAQHTADKTVTSDHVMGTFHDSRGNAVSETARQATTAGRR